MPAKHSKVKIGGFTPMKVVVEDITDCEEVKEITKKNGEKAEIKFPFMVKIVTVKGKKTVLEEPSTSFLRTKDWSKKFYGAEYTDSNGDTQVNHRFTQNHALLAISAIFEGKEKADFNKIKEFDVNEFIGFEFEAKVVELEDGHAFIDWAQTFTLYNITLPFSDKKESQTEGTEDIDDEIPI